jgi:hypothetical protein
MADREKVRFWRIVKETLHRPVMIDGNASLSERVFYFRACKEHNAMGIGRDFSEHPLNPLK